MKIKSKLRMKHVKIYANKVENEDANKVWNKDEDEDEDEDANQDN